MALKTLAATGPSLRPLVLAHLEISSLLNPIYVHSASAGHDRRYHCESCSGGGQGNALTSIIFPTAINGALMFTERGHSAEVRAQQDDKRIFGEPAECADKPEWLDRTAVVTDPAARARFECRGC